MLRVSLRDVAKAADVHVTTVSQALRGTGRLSAETRGRIQTLAKEMGYVPDPALSALASYRNEKQGVRFHAVLAFLNNFPAAADFHRVPVYHSYFVGAQERAVALGYKVEEFWLGDPRVPPRRLASMLRARGIQGVLVGPQAKGDVSLDWPWEQFSSVTFGFSVASPGLDRVTNDQFGTMEMLIRNAVERGYRRIGWVSCEIDESRVRWAWSAAFLTKARRHPECCFLPPLIPKDFVSAGELLAWIKREKPDLIITGQYAHLNALRDAGLAVPKKVGVLLTTLREDDIETSGAYQNDRRIGGVAVEAVVAMLNRNDRGVPGCPLRTLVSSEWRGGNTVRPAP